MLAISWALSPISSSDWWSRALMPLMSPLCEKASYWAMIAGEKAPLMSKSFASKPGAVSCERLGSEAKEWSVAVLGAAEAEGVVRSGAVQGQDERVSMWSWGG